MATTVSSSASTAPHPSSSSSAPRLLVSPPLLEAIPSTLPHDSSDCGSSSGVGGMKGTSHEPASSDEASSSSEQTPATVFPSVSPLSTVPLMSSPGVSSFTSLPHRRPHATPSPLPIPHTGGSPIAGPFFSSPPTISPPLMANDLFVHVQVGETLSILVGNDVQHITGPATVRMVGESGVVPSALPLNVPPGHMIHQIVDEQGLLRHLILSPEVSSQHSRILPPSTSSAIVPPCNVTPLRQTNGGPPFYTVNRKYPRIITPKQPMPDVVAATATVHTENGDIDSEDYRRIQDMLNRMMPPTLARLTPYEVDLSWQELDTSEACAAGPFPQLDASEFSYQIQIQDMRSQKIDTRRISQRMEPDGTRPPRCRIARLQPNRDYRATIRAALEERGMQGEPSHPIAFKTPSGRPDPPYNIKFDAVGTDFIVMRWNAPDRDNGAAIQTYIIHRIIVKETQEEETESFIPTSETKIRMDQLSPATTYNFRITAKNRFGESIPSPLVATTTRVTFTPFTPIVGLNGPRSVRVSWHSQQTFTYSMELLTGGQQCFFIRKSHPANFVFFNDLMPNTEYTVRMVAVSGDNEIHNCESVMFRTPISKHRLDREIINHMPPPKPYVLSAPKENKRLEIGWKQNMGGRDSIFNLEGAINMNGIKPEWRCIYKGNATSYMVSDPQMSLFRLQIVYKKTNIISEWSDVLIVPIPVVRPRLPQMEPPTFNDISKHCIKLTWKMPEGLVMPLNATLLFDLRRIDGVSQLIYSGPEMTFLFEGLRPRQHISVQVRAVGVEYGGGRVEGEWSSIGSGCTVRDAPPPPHSLRLSEDRRELMWSTGEDVMDMIFSVSRYTQMENGEQMDGVTIECNTPKISLSQLIPGCTYAFQVVTKSKWGDSPSSEVFRFTTAAEVPAAPDSMSVESDNESSLNLRWTAPDCRGSALRSYHIKVERAKEIIRERMMSTSMKEKEMEMRLNDLEPDTVYKLSVIAMNDVGMGPSSSLEGRTRRPLPPPPILYSEAENNQMKLKWKSPECSKSASLGYRIVRLNDANDGHIPVYDGENTSAKIKNLQEDTLYRFQIRSIDRETGCGGWSEVFSFRTTLTAPFPVRSAPSSSSLGNGIHQIEWTNVIPKTNPRGLFYRLQTHETTGKRDLWNTAYEGTTASYSLRVPSNSSVQARVVVVRPDGKEGLQSQSSPPLHVSNIGERMTDKIEEEPRTEEINEHTVTTTITRFLKGHILEIVLFISFILLSLSMTYVCYFFMELLGFSTSNTKPLPPSSRNDL